MLQIPDAIQREFPGYCQGLNLILWEIFIGSLFMWALVSWINANRAELENIKKTEKTRAFFGLMYAFSRIFFIFGVVLNDGAQYDFWTNMGYLFSMIGLTVYISGIERYTLNAIPIFTLFGIISSIITLTGFENLIPGLSALRKDILVFVAIASAVLTIILAYLYIQLISKFPGSLRKRTSYELLGIIFFVLGIIMDGEWFLSSPTNPLFYKEIIPPIMATMGIFMVSIAHNTAEKLLPITIVFGIVLVILFLSHIGDFYS
jgi:hypothetical protein